MAKNNDGIKFHFEQISQSNICLKDKVPSKEVVIIKYLL